jgi:hypothetical protein
MKKALLYLLEVFGETHYGYTGEKAKFSGIWRSGEEYIPLSKGERFIPSTNGEWVLVCKL